MEIFIVLLLFIDLITRLIEIISKEAEIDYNMENSHMGVRCNARGKCEFRFTTACDTCKHNCGSEQQRNFYEPK